MAAVLHPTIFAARTFIILFILRYQGNPKGAGRLKKINRDVIRHVLLSINRAGGIKIPFQERAYIQFIFGYS